MFRDKQGWKIVALAVLALLPLGAAQAQIGPGPFAYFPTGDVTDGRFLGFGCTGIATFEQAVNIGIAAPSDQVDFALNLFDGDTGRPDTGGKPHWDAGTRQLVYRLYADPLRHGSTDPGNLIGEWFGNSVNPLSGPNWTASAATMPDNDWWAVMVTNMPLAQAPSGHFFYNLSITTVGACTTGEQLVSNLKVATSNPLAFLMPRFAFEAGLRNAANDIPIIYPGLVLPTSGRGFLDAFTTYDGTFEFFLELPPGETDLKLFDGDFDLGTAANLIAAPSGVLLTPCFDLDDLDTPADYSNLPFPAAGATPEGVQGPGSPADDSRIDSVRRGEVDDPDRIGCIRYEVTDPLGNVYFNDNPSGSFEWEQFRVATNLAVNPGDSDYQVGGDYLPAGVWKVRSIGLDMANLNFWAADACSVQQSGSGGSATWLPGQSSSSNRVTTVDGEYEAACPRINSFLLGDTVYRDLDGDGTQDAGEAGIPGVVLNLRKQVGGPIIGTVVTGNDSDPNWAACVALTESLDLEGLYCFGTDDPGTYIVEIAPENFDAGRALAGLSSTTGGEEQTFALVDTNVLTYDFGYRVGAAPSVDIGDRVWLDLNGDGVQDTGEPGLDGVLVHLLDAGGNLAGATSTAAGGLYQFTDVAAGSYTVRVVAATLPAGLAPTFDLDGVGTPHEAAVTVGAADRNDVDFGYRGTASLGDRVWNDADGDGTQEAGEAGIDGVTVELLDGGGIVVATTVTGGDGGYTFGNLLGGTYTVRIVPATLPAGVAATYDLDGLGTPHQATLTLAGGASRTDVDFGYRTSPVIDLCAEEAVSDPAYNNGPNGHAFYLPGIAIDLAFAPASGSFTTSADGTAHLSGTVRRLSNAASGFTVDVSFTGYQVAPPPGSPKKELSANAYAENGGPIDTNTWWYYTGYTGTLTGFGDYAGAVIHITRTGEAFQVGAGANGKNLNFGASGWFDWTVSQQPTSGGPLQTTGVGDINIDIVECPQPASVGDRLWLDGDGNGVQDAGEPGISDATVELVYQGVVLATATTDANGNYLFPNVAPGTYTVQVVSSSLPAGSAPTFDLDGTGTPHAATFTLASGIDRTDVDFGYRGTASIGDRLWRDNDGDGVQDGGEPGLNGVTVELLDDGGNVIATVTTAGNGNYSFGNLAAGTYTVQVVDATLPAGLAPTFDADGIATAHTAAVTLAGGEARTDVDFGYRGTASIGDRVWNDIDGDGVQDAGEAGLNGVTVELLDDGNVIATETTSGDGTYTFGNLAAGTYTVRVVDATLPAGLAPTFDADGIGTAHTVAVTLTGNASRTDVDFGYRGTASIGDRLWIDSDGDGVQDGDEAGLNGITVQLLDGGGNVIATETTAGDGTYTFGNLSAGSYSVRVVAATLPAGLVPTFDADGIGTAHTAAVTLTGGASRTDIDFGYRGTASLGDRLWIDGDGDGVQDGGEAGINGATVQLLDASDNVIATTTTAGDGNYSFTNLLAGNYTVRVVAATLPAGLAPTFDLDGIGTAHTAAVTLAGGASRTDVDFGYRGTASLGDRLWIDGNGDGVQDGGEAGINGVTVQLLDANDNVIATTTTAGDGNYGFAHLLAGSYTVRVVAATLPAGLAPTFDADGIGTAHTAAVALTASASRTDVDFGYRGTASIGDRVWNDVDGDGVQDGGEAGINGVTVQLLNAGGNVIATTTTAGDGNYSFGNLLAGTYRVRIVTATLPAGMVPTYDLDGTGTAHIATLTLAAGAARADVDFGYRQPATNPGTGTIGYWKNHSQAWPVQQITLGGVTYTKAQALAIIGQSSRGDKSIDLAKQLIATKLNVIIGNDASCIAATITAADAWLAQHPVGSGVGGSSGAWAVGGPLHQKLDDYNNGRLCAPHRG